MRYIAITRFADLQDGRRIYEAGDEYPRPGFSVSAERLAELAGSDNRMGKPLIVDVDAPCGECAVEAPQTPIEAAGGKPGETPAEPVKATRRGKRGRRGEE